MLINPDHVKYTHEEYERRVARFQLERQVYKARRASTKAKSGLVGHGMRLFTWLAATLWRRIGRNGGRFHRAEGDCVTPSEADHQPNAQGRQSYC
ncbi:MAG: hypothetical protein R3C14_23190 [Caldilineaceae bacterium]